MHLQELSSRGEEGLEIPLTAIATLEALAEKTQLELQGMLLTWSFKLAVRITDGQTSHHAAKTFRLISTHNSRIRLFDVMHIACTLPFSTMVVLRPDIIGSTFTISGKRSG